MKAIRYELGADGIATITHDAPGAPVNTMTEAWEKAFAATVERLAKEKSSIKGVILAEDVTGPYDVIVRAEARNAPGHYDLVHSHYWLSGQVGYLAKDRWGVPLVHSAHTLAKVKNAAMADDDEPEPRGRVIGEQQVVAEADRLASVIEGVPV